MSVNKVILIGNVGKDVETKHLENSSVSNFSLATTEKGYTSKNGTSVPEKTEWHNIVCWRGLSTLAEKYIRKGMKLYIEGKIRTRSWEDQSGVKKYATEIYAENIEMPQQDKSPQQRVAEAEHTMDNTPSDDGLPF